MAGGFGVATHDPKPLELENDDPIWLMRDAASVGAKGCADRGWVARTNWGTSGRATWPTSSLVLDGDPLADIRHLRKPAVIIRGGAVYNP